MWNLSNQFRLLSNVRYLAARRRITHASISDSSGFVGRVFAFCLPLVAQDLEPETYRPSTEETIPSYQRPTPREIVRSFESHGPRRAERDARIAAQELVRHGTTRDPSASTPFTAPDPLWWDQPIQRPYAYYEALKRPFEQRVWGDVTSAHIPVRAANQHPAVRR